MSELDHHEQRTPDRRRSPVIVSGIAAATVGIFALLAHPITVGDVTIGIRASAPLVNVTVRQNNYTLRVGTGESPEPSGDSVSIVFYSGWDAATGNTSAAIKDGGVWGGAELCSSAQGWDSVQAVTAAPGTPPAGITNAMRHEYIQIGGSGDGGCGGIMDTTLVDGEDIYVRVWVYTDETENLANHALTIASGQAPNAFQWMVGKEGTANGWILQLKGPLGDIPHLGTEFAFYAGDPVAGVRDTLEFNHWYRFEALIDYLGDTANAPYQMHPRLYDSAGVLLYDDSTFIGSDNPTTITLQTMYANGDSFPVQEDGDRRTLVLSQEGATGLTDNRGEFFWWAGLGVSDSTWLGTFVPGS